MKHASDYDQYNLAAANEEMMRSTYPQNPSGYVEPQPMMGGNMYAHNEYVPNNDGLNGTRNMGRSYASQPSSGGGAPYM